MSMNEPALKAMIEIAEVPEGAVVEFGVLVVAMIMPDGKHAHAIVLGGTPLPTQVAGLLADVSHTTLHNLTPPRDVT